MSGRNVRSLTLDPENYFTLTYICHTWLIPLHHARSGITKCCSCSTQSSLVRKPVAVGSVLLLCLGCTRRVWNLDTPAGSRDEPDETFWWTYYGVPCPRRTGSGSRSCGRRAPPVHAKLEPRGPQEMGAPSSRGPRARTPTCAKARHHDGRRVLRRAEVSHSLRPPSLPEAAAARCRCVA